MYDDDWQFCADGMRSLPARDRRAENLPFSHTHESHSWANEWKELSLLSLSVVKWLRPRGPVLMTGGVALKNRIVDRSTAPELVRPNLSD